MIAKMPAFDPDFFADEFISQPTTPKVVTEVPVVRQKITVTPASSGRTYLLKPAARWDWKDLADYVVAKILELHPDLLPKRDSAKEFGIFSGFAGRHGDLAGPIAVYAFEGSATPGIWNQAPIGLGRFSRGSDEYFAMPIIEALT